MEVVIVYLAIAWVCVYFGLFALTRLGRRIPIFIFSLGLLGTLLVGHWTVLRTFPEGRRSLDWPSTEAHLVRFHPTKYLGIRRWQDLRALDMPYLYSVNGINYRGTRYSMAGNFVGTFREISALTDDRSAAIRAYYDPNRPSYSVLVPGPLPASFNLHTVLPATLFGLFVVYSALRWRQRNAPPTAMSSARQWLLRAFKVLVGAIALVFLMDMGIWLIGRDAHGLNGDYAVLREEPMSDGIEYWIAVGAFWEPWEEEKKLGRAARLINDARDKQFIAADGSLKDITRRKWTIYQIHLRHGSKTLPANSTPDWIMTWTSETGFHTEPVSEKAKREMKRHKE